MAEPLGSLFVPDGEFFVVFHERKAYGPFFNEFVAREWARDAFGRDALIGRMSAPWRVTSSEPDSDGSK